MLTIEADGPWQLNRELDVVSRDIIVVYEDQRFKAVITGGVYPPDSDPYVGMAEGESIGLEGEGLLNRDGSEFNSVPDIEDYLYDIWGYLYGDHEVLALSLGELKKLYAQETPQPSTPTWRSRFVPGDRNKPLPFEGKEPGMEAAHRARYRDRIDEARESQEEGSFFEVLLRAVPPEFWHRMTQVLQSAGVPEQDIPEVLYPSDCYSPLYGDVRSDMSSGKRDFSLPLSELRHHRTSKSPRHSLTHAREIVPQLESVTGVAAEAIYRAYLGDFSGLPGE